MAVTLTYTATAPVATPVPEPIQQQDRLFGRDVWLDVTEGRDADYVVSPAGDWTLAAGREALRQSIIRRIITDPGEWATLPEYGVGARMFVKTRNTQAARDELEERIRAQLLRDRRIESVETVEVEITADKVRIGVVVLPRGRAQENEPVRAAVEVP